MPEKFWLGRSENVAALAGVILAFATADPEVLRSRTRDMATHSNGIAILPAAKLPVRASGPVEGARGTGAVPPLRRQGAGYG